MAEVYTVKSYAKGVDIAPRKVSVVASLVRNRTVADALVILDHVPRRAGLPIKKAISSAQANAVNNHGLDANSLQITTLSVTVGKRLKRFKPHMRGMALPFQKISTNILVEVSGTEKPKRKPAAKTAAADKPNVEEEA
jgi:large subunit ribosomal protein L22